MKNKPYRAIFFDWDGTAVASRKAPVDTIVPLMSALLEKGVYLLIISGTTAENIAGGTLAQNFSACAQKRLYMGLARGAYNYGFNRGSATLLQSAVPSAEKLLCIHDAAYALHKMLLETYGLETDIVFSRPNYCKIDLLAKYDRGEALFRQQGEAEQVQAFLRQHGCAGGLCQVIEEGVKLGQEYGVPLKITTDAKYLEIGPTTKSDNVDYLLELLWDLEKIHPEECSFWGDEFSDVVQGVPGSDALMITEKSRAGDFYDVGYESTEIPKEVMHLGGGISAFHRFLREQVALQ